MKITYSEYNSEEITKVLDSILEYRDELCVNTMLKDCQDGYIADGTARRKGKLFSKGATLVASLLVLRLFWWRLIAFGIPGVLIGALIFVGILKGMADRMNHLFGPEKIRLGTPAIYDHLNKYRVWENREGQLHITDAPEFYGFPKLKVRKNLKEGDMAYIVFADTLLGVANKISCLRGLAIASEQIKEFVDIYGEENVAIDMECVSPAAEQYQEDGTPVIALHEYVITLREITGMAGDTIVPTEYEEKKIRIPLEGGKEIYTKWKEHGILNLAYFDMEYAFAKKACETCKTEIPKRWMESGFLTDSNVIRDLNKLSVFAEPRKDIASDTMAQEEEPVFRFPEFTESGSDGAAMIEALKNRMKPES